jgi:hypothetical protein
LRILGIDPGDVQSAYALLEHKTMKVITKGIESNHEMLLGFMGDPETFFNEQYDVILIEYPAPRGQPMFTQLVDTIYWIGRFDQACQMSMKRIDRKDVKMTLCGTTRAGDPNISAAIKSIFSEHHHEYVKNNKGRQPIIGTAGAEGPLYGVKKDIWAALAVCMTYADGLGKESQVALNKGKTEKMKNRRTPRSFKASSKTLK